MTYFVRLAVAATAFSALAGCSRTPERPALSDDLKQDLASAGAADVQLAGATGERLQVVSAIERTEGAVAAPKAKPAARRTTPTSGTSGTTRSPKRVTPVAVQPTPPAAEPLPAEPQQAEPVAEPAPSQSRPKAPLPSTQREPPGGWKTPGQVIRNAPFPINP